MLLLSRSTNFFRNLRSRAAAQNFVLDGSSKPTLSLAQVGTDTLSCTWSNVSTTVTRSRVYYCSAVYQSLTPKYTSRPVLSFMPWTATWIDSVSKVFGKNHVLPASNVAPEIRSRERNVCVGQAVDLQLFSTGGINSIWYARLDTQNVELSNGTASPQVRYYHPMTQRNNATWHNWLGLHSSSARYDTTTTIITRPTSESQTNFGMSRYYHSHSDGVELELHPNTFNSSEKTRKFIKKLRKKQRALLLNELQTLNQESNKDVTQEDQNMLLPPSREQLRLVMLNNAVPFIGFGFLDNAIMIIAGDYIDWRIGAMFGISTLAAAGFGNLISDLAGVVLAGYVESFAAKFGIPSPNLSLEQYDMRGSKIASAVGRCVGIALGCLLGMFPLLFLKTDSKDETDSREEDTKNERS